MNVPEVSIRSVVSSRTAVVAGSKDLSRFMRDLDAVYEFLRSHPQVRQIGQNVARYGPGDHMEIGVEVDGPFPPTSTVSSSELPGGRIACATHTTGYDDLGMTYERIQRWCDDEGHATAGVQWEIYGDPDEHDHVDVEICFLLA